MIYTSYLANVKKLPQDMKKILVIRWKPRNTMNVEKYGMEWWPQLAPSELILSKYKDGSIDWKQYREMFIEHANTNTMFQDALEQVKELNETQDVCLICYEKNDLECHRSIIREILKQKYNIDSEEF